MFQFSERVSLDKRFCLLKIILPTERLSTTNRHLQDCYGVRAHPSVIHQVRIRAHARGCLEHQEAPFPLLSSMTTVLLLINPPCFVLTLSERLSALPVQLILSLLLVSSFLFPHSVSSLTADS